MTKLARFLSIVLVSLALPAHGQSVASRVRTNTDRDLLTSLVAAEDSRDSTVRPTDARRRGLASENAFIRAFTVRGLGRLERASLIPIVTPVLDDRGAGVRAAAADALAQAAAHGGAADARAALVRRFQVERDAAVRGALLEALGRLSQGSADQATKTANLIAPSLLSASPVERRGAIRGIFFLVRKPEARGAGVIPASVTDRAFAMLTEKASVGYSSADRVNMATAVVSSGAMSDARLLALFGHDDPYVRERAIGAVQGTTDTATIRAVIGRATKDTAAIVRFRAVAIFARWLRARDGCGLLRQMIHDADVSVALAAIDALSGCRGDSETTAHVLDSLTALLATDDRWHVPAHALAALSVIDGARARGQISKFEKADNFFVRMYAAAAARSMRDTAVLIRLANDRHPNVQSAAIAGLAALVGHTADSTYIAALTSDDNQLLIAASAALKGSTFPGVVVAVQNARKRLAAATPGRETAKDGMVALQARLLEFGAKLPDPGVIPFPKIATPTFAELATIEQTEATIEMSDGTIVTFRFHPFDAPTNAARFVRLSRLGTFNGLTFHRVAPFFVVQGPSPNANEYAAPDGPFTRDELGVDNARGTIGLSTRGRDTGDGQIYINTVDNTRLDHDYTVMATIVSGIEAFDRMQEGARIKRITLALSGGRSAR